jgi:hypothetical protein
MDLGMMRLRYIAQTLLLCELIASALYAMSATMFDESNWTLVRQGPTTTSGRDTGTSIAALWGLWAAFALVWVSAIIAISLAARREPDNGFKDGLLRLVILAPTVLHAFVALAVVVAAILSIRSGDGIIASVMGVALCVLFVTSVLPLALKVWGTAKHQALSTV